MAARRGVGRAVPQATPRARSPLTSPTCCETSSAKPPPPKNAVGCACAALIHDTFKYAVDTSHPRTGENHHGARARRFAERYLEDPELRELLELHDEAYDSWLAGQRDPQRGERRAACLIERLGPSLPLHLAFYRADSATGGKSHEPLHWFESLLEESAEPR